MLVIINDSQDELHPMHQAIQFIFHLRALNLKDSLLTEVGINITNITVNINKT